MRRVVLFIALVGSLLLPVSQADAAWRFGKDEEIRFIQDVTLKGANNEALYLGYMTRTQNFLAGLYIEDAGYVLGVKGESKKYYNMPTGEELARFQRNGTLPDPLPTYSLGFFDYFIGYSAWWVIALVIAWYAFDVMRKRKKAAAATPPATS